MNRIIVFAAAAIMTLLSCGHGPSNMYLGRLPTLISENGNAEWKPGGKYNALISEEKGKLEGVRIPCISGNPDFFEIIGDNAIFHKGEYNVMLRFTAPVKVESTCDVFFTSLKADVYGIESPVFPNLSGNYAEGDFVILSFSIHPDSVYDEDSWDKGVMKLQKNTEAFFMKFKKDKISGRRRSLHNTSCSPTQEIINYYMNNDFDEDTKEILLAVKSQGSLEEAKDVPKVGDYEYVDLGLSVNWAVDNIGGYPGDLFAWGETTSKEKVDNGPMWSENACWEGYSFYEGETTSYPYRRLFSKYVIDGDNKTVLESVDDPATAIMGAPWRTPTKEEWQELINKCEEIKADEGEIGLVGPNGNKIFFSVYGIYGNYWSSSLFDTQRAWYAEFRSIWNGPAASFYSKPRYDLLCIRAVVDRE